MTGTTIPTEAEVLGYFDSLSNWGRWGADDELGALNFLTPEKVRQAASLVRDGHQVSCARTVEFEASVDAPNPPVHFMIESGEGWATGDKVTKRAAQGSSDFFGMAYHGVTITHIDSLCHFFWQGRMYNDRPGPSSLHLPRRDGRVGRERRRRHRDARSAGRRADDPGSRLDRARRGRHAGRHSRSGAPLRLHRGGGRRSYWSGQAS